MQNPFTLMTSAADVKTVGKQLADPNTWANRETASAKVVELIKDALPLINEFMGTNIEISSTELFQAAHAVADLGFIISRKLHTDHAAAGK